MPVSASYIPSNAAFYGIGITVGGSGWVYDPFATFPFLKLPAEIRNKIYAMIVPFSRVLISAHSPQKEVAHCKRLRPRRKAPTSRYHLQSDILSDTARRDFTTTTAFLKVCRPFNQEVASLFYARTTFCFMSIKHINKFLDVIPATGKKEVTNIEIAYSGYGEPKWTKDEFWKKKSDWKWAMVCTRLSQELPALRDVSINIRIADWPIQLNPTADCFVPLEILKGGGLERVRIKLRHYRFHESRCGSVARALEDMMMTPEGRDLRDMEEAVEAVRQFEAKEAQKALLPPQRARQVLVIRDIPTVNSNVQLSERLCTRPCAGGAPSRPVFRTKGLEGWSRINLDKVGVSWCGPAMITI